MNIRHDPIERAYEARNLGLLMDVDLRFMKHVPEIVRHSFYRLKILYHVRDYLSEKLRIQIVETLILSKLNYADVVYGPRIPTSTRRRFLFFPTFSSNLKGVILDSEN